MTTYMAAYDTENENCIDALPRIVKVHEKYDMPATFFAVVRLLGEDGAECKRLIGNHPLFEIASHSYTHMLLREHRLCGHPGPSDQYEREIVGSKQRLEEHFECAVSGFRPAVCFTEGFRGAPHLLGLCRQAGYRYVSTVGWGPHDSLPALPIDAFDYAEDGYPDLLEVPPCGWHENLLKGNNRWDPRPIQLYPHPMPEAAVMRFIETPREEFDLDKLFIEKAVREGVGHVSLVWHPWSLHMFDPKMKMLELMFQYVRDCRLPVATFAEFVGTLR